MERYSQIHLNRYHYLYHYNYRVLFSPLQQPRWPPPSPAVPLILPSVCLHVLFFQWTLQVWLSLVSKIRTFWDCWSASFWQGTRGNTVPFVKKLSECTGTAFPWLNCRWPLSSLKHALQNHQNDCIKWHTIFIAVERTNFVFSHGHVQTRLEAHDAPQTVSAGEGPNSLHSSLHSLLSSTPTVPHSRRLWRLITWPLHWIIPILSMLQNDRCCQCQIFLQARYPSCHPTNSIKTLKNFPTTIRRTRKVPWLLARGQSLQSSPCLHRRRVYYVQQGHGGCNSETPGTPCQQRSVR